VGRGTFWANPFGGVCRGRPTASNGLFAPIFMSRFWATVQRDERTPPRFFFSNKWVLRRNVSRIRVSNLFKTNPSPFGARRSNQLSYGNKPTPIHSRDCCYSPGPAFFSMARRGPTVLPGRNPAPAPAGRTDPPCPPAAARLRRVSGSFPNSAPLRALSFPTRADVPFVGLLPSSAFDLASWSTSHGSWPNLRPSGLPSRASTTTTRGK